MMIDDDEDKNDTYNDDCDSAGGDHDNDRYNHVMNVEN